MGRHARGSRGAGGDVCSETAAQCGPGAPLRLLRVEAAVRFLARSSAGVGGERSEEQALHKTEMAPLRWPDLHVPVLFPSVASSISRGCRCCSHLPVSPPPPHTTGSGLPVGRPGAAVLTSVSVGSGAVKAEINIQALAAET